MGKRRAIVAATASLAGCACWAIVACSSSHPPVADFSSADSASAAEVGTSTNKRVSGGGATGSPLCTDDSDSGFREPAGPCSCDYAYGPNLIITLSCGNTLCSQGKQEAAVCSRDGKLTVIPHFDFASCADAGASDLDSLPPCDAGTTPTPTTNITDAGAD